MSVTFSPILLLFIYSLFSSIIFTFDLLIILFIICDVFYTVFHLLCLYDSLSLIVH